MHFICCKAVDLAETSTCCAAPPVSGKAANAEVRAAFKSQEQEVGGKNCGMSSAVSLFVRCLTSDHERRLFCLNGWNKQGRITKKKKKISCCDSWNLKSHRVGHNSARLEHKCCWTSTNSWFTRTGGFVRSRMFSHQTDTFRLDSKNKLGQTI